MGSAESISDYLVAPNYSQGIQTHISAKESRFICVASVSFIPLCYRYILKHTYNEISMMDPNPATQWWLGCKFQKHVVGGVMTLTVTAISD
jgi:hypothetical protein